MAVAELLNSWVKTVLQPVKPWLSTHGINRGEVWVNSINEHLKTSVGIVCLTQENKGEPWIHFEAGALSKTYPDSRVCTLLIDLAHTDVGQPLAQFNHSLPTNKGMWELVQTLNQVLAQSNRSIDAESLKRSFDSLWPWFNKEFKSALEKHPAKPKRRPKKNTDRALQEILALLQSFDKRLSQMEQTPSYTNMSGSQNNTGPWRPWNAPGTSAGLLGYTGPVFSNTGSVSGGPDRSDWSNRSRPDRIRGRWPY
jgi:hypothetical protein